MTTPQEMPTVRLAKRLSEDVPCSRREAELYIEGGWVTVDGEVVDEPQFKVAEQTVALLPDAVLTPPEPVTILFHQLPELTVDAAHTLISPATLSAEHRFGTRPLKGHFLRLNSAAPLQHNAAGLLVFTQDWKILRKLTDDLAKLEQEYVVEVTGDIIEHGLSRLNQGRTIKGKVLPPVKASWQNETRLRIVLKNPTPGLLAALCASVGLTPVGIKRIRIGGVSMGKLPAGQWRYLAKTEKF
jgi:23S rRNA pseudouridine2604 synthase